MDICEIKFQISVFNPCSVLVFGAADLPGLEVVIRYILLFILATPTALTLAQRTLTNSDKNNHIY